MQYDPESTNENLIPNETWCEALIESAEDRISKKGNQMIVAGFKCYDPKGLQPTITHYFVDSMPGFFKKLCAVIGLDYASGNIPAESLVGKSVKVLVKIREDETGQYPDKNVIAGFEKIPSGAQLITKPEAKDVEEDSPF